ncbi:MAG: radical SAM protein [Candidatus Omnitrophica bacterium]|nr:radical SAM protein [Candidatus Omnitrophota bacterium]
MKRLVILYKYGRDNFGETLDSLKPFANIAIGISRNGIYWKFVHGKEKFLLIRHLISRFELIKYIFNRFGKETEIIYIHEKDQILKELIIDFINKSQDRSYYFSDGKEIIQKFFIEKITYRFFKNVIRQEKKYLRNALFNGAPEFTGNMHRYWITNKFRKHYFLKSSCPPYSPSYSCDLTHRCNLSCVKCPYHKPDASGRMGWRNKPLDMDINMFKKIVENAYPRTMVYLSISGESILHPGFFDAVKYLRKKRMRFSHTSNGTLLTKDILKSMLDSGLSSLSISIDAFKEETYKKIVPNGDFYKTIRNIEKCARLMSSYNKPLNLLYLLMPNLNEEEFGMFRKRWMPKVAGIVTMLWSDPATEKQYKSYELHLPDERFACIQPYQMQVISTDGLVSACCRDYNSEMMLGDLKLSRLPEIWNGGNLKKFRNSMLLDDGSLPMHPVCAGCDMWHTGCGYYEVDGNISIYTEKHHNIYTNFRWHGP